MNRPEGCRFWTAEDVVDWIGKNVPPDRYDGTLYDAALWWQACINAESIHDMSFKDTARLLLDGCKPVSTSDIDDELQIPHIDAEASVDAIDSKVEGNLREFFGLNKEA